jgi:hypothetical protein
VVTQDAAVGVVLTGESLLRMPAINRSALTFFQLQPMVTPTRGIATLGAGQHLSGQVAGARADQTTFTVDGLDASRGPLAAIAALGTGRSAGMRGVRQAGPEAV